MKWREIVCAAAVPLALLLTAPNAEAQDDGAPVSEVV